VASDYIEPIEASLRERIAAGDVVNWDPDTTAQAASEWAVALVFNELRNDGAPPAADAPLIVVACLIASGAEFDPAELALPAGSCGTERMRNAEKRAQRLGGARSFGRKVWRVFERASGAMGAGAHAERVVLSKPDGWLKQDLVSQAKDMVGDFSARTFDRVRELAGLPSPPKGGVGQQHRYGRADLRRLVDAARSGPFRKGSKIAQAWEQLLPARSGEN